LSAAGKVSMNEILLKLTDEEPRQATGHELYL
jgi:hypothetical protein